MQTTQRMELMLNIWKVGLAIKYTTEINYKPNNIKEVLAFYTDLQI